MTDISPCPFCGGRAITTHLGAQKRLWRCGCEKTDCIGSACRYTFYGWDDEDEAIEAWNRRSSTPPPMDGEGDLVARLRAWDIIGKMKRSFEVQRLCDEAATAIEALRAERDEVEAAIYGRHERGFVMRPLIDPPSVVDAVRSLSRQLARYGGHAKDCQRPRGPECDCGWDEIARRAKETVSHG